jgi:prepilin-type N-terminal cleavage/methylation domain-containing protein
MRTNSGFTLIELAIVIVIVGILAAVAIPRFTDMTEQARRAQRQSIAASINSAFAIYLASNNGNRPTWNQLLQGYLQNTPTGANGLKFNNGQVYMDYDGNNAPATNNSENVVRLYSDANCTTVVTNATTPIFCITTNVN